MKGPSKNCGRGIVMELQKSNITPAMLDDCEIIELYWLRDEKAIRHTDKKYKKHLIYVGQNILHNYEDAEECVNDTYLGAWNSIPPARPKSLRAFLTIIMRRISINKYHANRKSGNIPSELTVSLCELENFLDDSYGEGNEIDTYLLGRVISDFVYSLSKRDRYIFMSRYYMSNTVDRIAKDLSLSRSAVNKILARIRCGLKEKLESEGYTV